MSNQNQSPIRVADLSESVYVPRVPASSKAYVDAAKTPSTRALDEQGSQYIWNRQPDEDRELAEMRAQFAHESEQSVAVLRPVVVDDLFPDVEEATKVSEFFEQVLASPAVLQRPRTTRVWGLNYHAVDMEQTLDYLEQVIGRRQPSYAVTANLNYAMLCVKNSRLAAFTQKAALTLCDGMPVLWRSKLNSIKLPERVEAPI